eukprot:gene15540-18421_t
MQLERPRDQMQLERPRDQMQLERPRDQMQFERPRDRMQQQLRALGLVAEMQLARPRNQMQLERPRDQMQQQLRALGLDPMGEYGWTPLHIAARGGHIKVLQELLKVGASKDLHRRPSDMGPALVEQVEVQCAVCMTEPTPGGGEDAEALPEEERLMVQCILNVAAPQSPQSADDPEQAMGETPLHVAADQGQAAAVRELLCAGADPELLARLL